MSTTDWLYILLSIYFVVMGVLGINLKIPYLSLTLKFKVFDLEYLYGTNAARVIFIILGGLVILYRFVVVDYLFGGLI